jgi:GH25 family lysozyme M1 (1,4-beta-N-acetylmuramidase)
VSITFADISEFQENFNADAYINGGYRVVIVRAHNGYRADKQWPGRRDYVRSKNFTAVGYYQYLAKDRDAAQQAHEFVAALGRNLRPNEFPILDLEEGAGNQTGRADAWFKVVDPWCGFLASLYTGKSFLDKQLGGVARWGRRPLWIAAYLNSYRADMASYPPGAEWWQYSSRERFPGLVGGVDASVYPGDLQHFLPVVKGGSGSTPVQKQAPQSLVSVVKADGRIEVFEEKASGEVVHKWQTAVNDGWVESWQSLGKP